MAETTNKKAGRPKKTTTTNTNTTAKVEAVIDTEEQLKLANEKNAIMEKQLEQMQKMMAEMQEKMANMAMPQQIIVQQEANKDATRMVKVTCMVGNTYWLSTEPYGKGKTYRFEGYGDSKNIKFTDMISILETYGTQFEQGMAILGSKKDYEDLQLDYCYNDIFTKEQMDNIVNLVTDDDVNIILNMQDEMQENVLYMIADKVVDKFNYDYNKIKKLEDNTNLEKIIESAKIGRDTEDEE